MNCQCFRKYAGAFADGELDVEHNLEALEHLNMCLSCAQRAEEIHRQKLALKRVYVGTSAPTGLRKRVLAALRRAGAILPEPALALVESQQRPAMRRAGLRLRFLIPFSMAAAVVLYLGLSFFWPGANFEPGSMTLVSSRLVSDIRAQHDQCVSARGVHHTDPLIPNTLAAYQSRYSRELGFTVLAPDLSDRGYRLMGGDLCGIRGRRAAHLLYSRENSNKRLSVFTCCRATELSPNIDSALRSRDYFVSTDDNPLTVLAWHLGGQTYAICAPVPPAPLIEMFDRVQVADLPTVVRMVSHLASAYP